MEPTLYRHPHGHVFYRGMNKPRPMIARAEGICLYDTGGKRYLDASGGPVLANIGYGVTEVIEAMTGQAQTAPYIHATMFTGQAIEDYSNALAEVTPLPQPRFFFLSSGSEAVETAIKFARQMQVANGRTAAYKIIARWQSYHGTTLGALSVSGRPALRRFYEPMLAAMPHIEPPYCYRCPFTLAYPACGLRCAHALADEIKMQGRETVAAFLAEPISGASLAAVVPPAEYWPLIRQICDAFNILLIDDEVMTGLGRTGNWFAITAWDIEPDIITMGKGTAGGYFPLSITAMRGDHVEAMRRQHADFNHGGTFSHHPIGAAVGLATLRYLQTRNLIAAAAERGRSLEARLRAAFGSHPHVGDIRGRGLMWGLEFVADRAAKTPFPAAERFAYKLANIAFERGLIIYPSRGNVDGEQGDQVMIAPPFVVTEAELDEIVGLLQESVAAALAA